MQRIQFYNHSDRLCTVKSSAKMWLFNENLLKLQKQQQQQRQTQLFFVIKTNTAKANLWKQKKRHQLGLAFAWF